MAATARCSSLAICALCVAQQRDSSVDDATAAMVTATAARKALMSATPTKPTVTCHFFSATGLLAAVDVDNLVLVDKLEDVWRVHEDADGADGGDQEEDPQLGAVHHHRHKFPVFSYL
jgi:hypothetical protein